MTLKLIIIRHAKSSWDDPRLDDHARVLNRRGQRAADAIGDWLAEAGHVPDQCLCSDAARTAETWARMSNRWDTAPEVSFHRDLYHAAPGSIREVVRETGQGAALAVIGHNPGIGLFAESMAAERPDHPDFGRYPTAATTILEFDAVTWASVRPQTGRLLAFVVPRDLTGGHKFT